MFGKTGFKLWGWALGVGAQSSGKSRLKPRQVHTAVSLAPLWGPSDPSSGIQGALAASPRSLSLEVVGAPDALGQEGRGAPGESATVTRPP